MEHAPQETLQDLISFFPPEMSQQLADGLAASFALIACADGRLHPSEPCRFSDLIEKCGDIGSLDKVRVEQAFEKQVMALMDNYQTAKPEALGAIARMCTNKRAIKAAIGLARIAVVADRKIAPQEELMIREIADAVGISANDI